MQYGLPMPVGLLRADNNLPPWRPGLKEVISCKLSFTVVYESLPCLFSCNLYGSFSIQNASLIYHLCYAIRSFELFHCNYFSYYII